MGSKTSRQNVYVKIEPVKQIQTRFQDFLLFSLKYIYYLFIYNKYTTNSILSLDFHIPLYQVLAISLVLYKNNYMACKNKESSYRKSIITFI